MIKNLFIISDVELGQGDIFDDFKDEDALLSFLKKLTNDYPNSTLILNGDTFDFLKMPYQGKFTHHITEEISIWKLNQIIKNYPKVFSALKAFLGKPHNHLHFNIGNHDQDLIWPGVQKELKKILNEESRITFNHNFHTTDLHIEHGNQVDYFYKLDTVKPFIKHKNKLLLNLPLGSVAVIKYFIELKKTFPFEEKHYPRHEAFENFPEFRKLKQKISYNFVVKGLLLSFLINFFDPVYNVPYINLIKHIFAHGLEVTDESKFVKKRFKNMRKLYPGKKAYIMGHVHLTHHELNSGKDHIQIVTDTWREEYQIMSGKEKILKPKTYAHIVYQNDQLNKIDLLTFSD